MSISDDDLPSGEQPEERNPASSAGQPKISYTREHLLSLSELEICTRLPTGFDESLLSEFGSLPQQGVRRNEYGSSPPGKGETGNYSRGFQRWDSRASWRSDSDSQSEKDSDSGRRYGNQFRRPSQNPEHDGLLGSGSFPKPPGNGLGSSIPQAGVNDQHQVYRSNDPYHPSRPYKAVTHSWRETKDSLNDETFGMDEDTSEDRVEEERKRRVEFEMMRKGQQKELQEKLKLKAMGKLKNDPLTELAAALDSEDNATMAVGLDTSLVKPVQQNDSGKVSFSSQGHSSRPLVPPGFANAGTEKNSGPKSFGIPLLEVGKLETGDANQEKKSALQPSLDEKHSETAFPWASKGGKKVDLSSNASSSKVKNSDGQSLGASNIPGISKILGNDKVVGINSENGSGHKIVGEAGHSTSVFEKLFEGALSLKSTSPSNIMEDHNMKTGIDLSPKDFHSSKFAQWFLEEEKKPTGSGSSEKPNTLFSLIVGEKSESIASETNTTQQILPPETNFVKMHTLAPSDAGVSDSLPNKDRPERISAVLTCEDLEQSILSDIGGSSPSFQPPGKIFSQHGMENEIPKAAVNSNASQHLLSLLQKGIDSNSKTASPISMLDKGSPKKSKDMDFESKVQGHLRDLNVENLSSAKGMTLETLFGTTFMKELQSFDVPPTVHRNPAEPSSIDVLEHSMQPLAMPDNGAVYNSVSEARFKRVNTDDSISGLGRAHQTNLDKVGMNWLSVDSTQTDMESSNSQRFDVQLRREDSLSSLGLPVNAGRQDNSPFSHAPFDKLKLEIPFPIMHTQSPPQFNPTLLNQGMPMFPPLDPDGAHINPQFRFMPPEGITHQDAAIHRQISANPPFRHLSPGLSAFDHPIHPMLQQMHMPNIRPLALPGFPGGAPTPHHHGGNPPGYVQDHSLPHGFPFGQHHPNLGDLRVPRQGPEHGRLDNNPPQDFQRLIEMELRSPQKQMHPSFPAVGGHSRPMHGHEPDAGFWYR